MRFLLINYEYPPTGAGAATATQATARALCELGHHVHVVTSEYRTLRGSTAEDGVIVHRIPAWRRNASSCSMVEMAIFALSACLRVRSLVAAHQIDYVVAYFSFPCGPVAWWSRRPFVISLRGGDVPGTEPSLARIHAFLQPIRRRMLRRAKAVVANSNGLRRLAETADLMPVSVIPNGVDTTFFQPRSKPRQAGPFRWLFVGRFQAQKNIKWLIRQFEALHLTAPGSFAVELVGEGPQREEIRHLVQLAGLDSMVKWRGWTERGALREVFHQADAVVNPSLYEGMPNVVLEAMACGVPVLASRVAGNDAVVADGLTGRLFDLDDTAQFTSIARSWMSDPIGLALLGKAARERAVSEYSWQRCAKAYVDLFDRHGQAQTMVASAPEGRVNS